MTNLDTVQQAVTFAKAAGADEAEAFLSRTRVLTIEVTHGQVETIKQAEDIGLTVRAIVAGRMGLAYASDLDEKSAERAAQRAIEVARASDPDPFVGFADPPAAWLAVEGYDAEMDAHSPDEKIDRALAIERAARQYDARIALTRRITYLERERQQAIANSRGLAAEQKNSVCGGLAMVIARQVARPRGPGGGASAAPSGGEQQSGFGSAFQRRYAAFDPSAVGVEAAERAVSLLGAAPAPTQRGSIVLEPKMTADFLWIIAHLVRADHVQKNKSLLAGKIGERVAASGLSIIDDGAHPEAAVVRAWDEEGVPSQRTTIIADGVLQNYLHTTWTARKANARSTSNASRLSFKASPDPMPSNLQLLPGKETAESLRAGVKHGLWVRQLMNLHTANPISGEFSFGASGLWIENGHLVGPVSGVTIAGNLIDLLTNIRGIANDRVWARDVSAPSVLIEEVSIAGK